MVKADMLYMLDLRLQEIKEMIGTPFGGIAVIVFGDMMQLKPCLGKYIFEAPSNADFKATYHLDSRWNMFESLILEKNHRQGKDKVYADLLNRLRTGDQTTDDIELLKTRVRPIGHQDVVKADMYIGCKKADVAKENLNYIRKFKGKGKLTLLKAKHHHATQKKFTPKIDKKDGGVGTTAFQDEVHVKIGAKIMIIHNIDIQDMLTNGQLGEIMHFILTKDGKVDKLIIKLRDRKAGQENQRKHSGVLSNFPGCVLIERVALQYTIRQRSGDVGATATVFQFPIRLAHATTAHKIQGQSLLYPMTVVLNIDSVFEPGQAYVMFSRVQCIDQVFILDKLNPTKIRTSQIAKNELLRLDQQSWNKNPSPWHQIVNKADIKIASLNCAGFLCHLQDIIADPKLREASFIALQETSLDKNHTIPSINGYQIQAVGRGRGKGVLTMTVNSLCTVDKNEESNISILKHSSDLLDIINVYRSKEMNVDDASIKLQKMIKKSKSSTLIVGDFNVCVRKNPQNAITKMLENLGFMQLAIEATQIEGNIIDHVYWKDDLDLWQAPVVERYSAYYTDHDAHLITLRKVTYI